MTAKFTPRFWLGLAVIASVVLLTAYALVYQFQPFASFWDDLLNNTFTALGAAFTAAVALLVMFQHDRQDAGFRVWLYFSIGFFLWAVAEIVWGYLNIKLGEVPTPSLPDYLWLAGYVFFGLGFMRQYRLLFSAPYWRDLLILIVIWVAVLGITRGAQILLGGTTDLGNFINWFYPIADLAICIMALRVAWIFRQGVMARPWLTLFVLGLSDGLYAWSVQTGLYGWSVNSGNALTLFVDTTYLAAYLILGLGFLSQYFLLRYGPWAFGGHALWL